MSGGVGYIFKRSEVKERPFLAYVLAYFPKMKGLSNHLSVCSPLITFEPLGRV
jgi:hypothetical protein